MWWRITTVLLGIGSIVAFFSAFYVVVLEKEAHEERLNAVRDQRALDKAAAPPASPEHHNDGPSPTMAWAAEPPLQLALPIDCNPGQNCWIVNYVDDDPSGGRRDFMCLDMSYDGHKGTDFALPNIAAIDLDVPVLAAAPGRVVGTRNDMSDVNFRELGREAIKDRECGNGIRIDHGDGWATQYCHMKQGSVLVSSGQDVERGQVLGAVGLSGLTEFPHLHLSVSKDGEVVDPFKGVDGAPECGPGATPLWQSDLKDALTYRAPKLLDLGLASRSVTREEAEQGALSSRTLSANGDVLIVWMRIAGGRKGDRAEIDISGPNGEVFRTDWTAEKTQIIRFQYMGKRTPEGGWPIGSYTGRIVLSRDGVVTAERTVEATLE
jgi:murein DD-endopeptidase MepM/ murein hydrolase activator NlpD